MNLRRGILCALLLAAGAGPAAAHPLAGLWLVEKGEARVRIGLGERGPSGRIVWIRDSLDANGVPRRDRKNPDPSLRDRRVLGLAILTDLRAVSADSTRWKGRIYDPKSGKTYSCSLGLETPDRLRIRGYVGFSLLGRTTRWTRVTGSSAIQWAPPEEGRPPGDAGTEEMWTAATCRP